MSVNSRNNAPNSHSEAPRKSKAPRRIWTEEEIKELTEAVESELKPPIVDWKFVPSMCSNFYEGRHRSEEACYRKWRELQSRDNLQKEKDHGTATIGEWQYEYRRIQPRAQEEEVIQTGLATVQDIPWYKQTVPVNVILFGIMYVLAVSGGYLYYLLLRL